MHVEDDALQSNDRRAYLSARTPLSNREAGIRWPRTVERIVQGHHIAEESGGPVLPVGLRFPINRQHKHAEWQPARKEREKKTFANDEAREATLVDGYVHRIEDRDSLGYAVHIDRRLRGAAAAAAAALIVC